MFKLNLRLFDGGTGASAGGTAGAEGSTTGANVNNEGTSGATYGAEGGKAVVVDRKAEFEKFKANYKPELDQLLQSTVKQRLKEHNKLKEANAEMNELVNDLAKRYGIDATDVKAIRTALNSDSSYFKLMAAESGMTEEEYKTHQELKHKSARLDTILDEQTKRQSYEKQIKEWESQSADVQQYYPDFNFETEIQSDEFLSLLMKGVKAKTAYEVVHNEEIISGAMARAAQSSRQQTIDAINARGLRADEGAIGSQPATQSKISAKDLTKSQREELIRRAERGEKIPL